MRDGDEWQPRLTEYLGLGSPEGTELIAADDDRGNIGVLELDGVVDTPRRAAASIGNGQNDGVALSEPGHHVLRRG